VVVNAPNRDNAVTFLEYMASEEAQVYFANGNNEYPAVEGVKVDNPALAEMGAFKADDINVDAYGRNQAIAQLLYDTAGWR
jgi:iron(III) transport system substrate-binding protein